MITATVTKDTNGIYKGFKVKGHALFEDAGKDIVCSAVSVLTINCVNSLEALTNSDFSLNTEDGIQLNFNKDPGNDAILLLDSYVLGLKGIEKEYQDYLRLCFEEV